MSQTKLNYTKEGTDLYRQAAMVVSIGGFLPGHLADFLSYFWRIAWRLRTLAPLWKQKRPIASQIYCPDQCSTYLWLSVYHKLYCQQADYRPRTWGDQYPGHWFPFPVKIRKRKYNSHFWQVWPLLCLFRMIDICSKIVCELRCDSRDSCRLT